MFEYCIGRRKAYHVKNKPFLQAIDRSHITHHTHML